MKSTLIFFAILGLTFATPIKRDLTSVLDDFLALVPVDDIKAIVMDAHLKNDVQFQTVVSYLQSEEWAHLVDDVRNLDEVKEFKKYLINAGLDVDRIIQFIHDLITGAHVGGNSASSMTRGLKDVVEEIEAVLDADAFVSLYQEEKQKDPAFAELIEKIKSHEAYELAEKVRAMDEVQRLEGRLTLMGFDVDGIRNTIYHLLGWI